MAVIIGIILGAYTVYAVVFVYKFKGTAKVGIVRILSVSSVAIVASMGHYLLRYYFGDGTSLDFDVAIAFCFAGIFSMVFFFWLNRKKIG